MGQYLVLLIALWKSYANLNRMFFIDSAPSSLAHCLRFQTEDHLIVHTSLVILGAGYTARFLFPLTLQQYDQVFATSRDPTRHLGYVMPEQRIQFDLTRQDTWKNIPVGADLLWCFPAAPLDLVQKFASTLNATSRRLVVLGSTSAYNVGESSEYPPPWIDESAPINLAKPRVQGEEYLRKERGAIVLRVAGIYGPGRNPIDWIRTGHVGPTRKYVNLIHVEDLAAICLLALEKGIPGEVYNVSDGTPRTWDEICRFTEQRREIRSPALATNNETGKRIAITKLTGVLGVRILHSDLFEELEQIQR